ncbi:MAG TPA: hypothetical protein VIO64_05140 [Pseudobacteroides sp.]|uniref:hypothetical protein n=1 Tax=Pseudobacteroides sp. TaxID=1968840 RepID=UPI002F93D369
MKNSLFLKKLCTSIFFTAIILLCYWVIANAAILEDESNGGNNTMSAANILPRNYLNQLVKGSIGTSQDIDYFKFTPTTDINLSFDLSADFAGYKTNVEIYQQGLVNRCNYGNVRYDYSVKKNTLKLLYSFKANNTYYIYISNNNSGFFGYNYEFVLTETSYECEPNDTLGSAIGNPFYMITMGTINGENDVDYYSFIPSNSGGYTFDISDSFNGQYLQSYLYDKDSNLIDGGIGATKLIGDSLKAGQIYYIKICPNGSNGISYGIVAKFLRPQYDEVEANNSFNLACPLSNDYYKLNNANLSSSSDLDFYKFIPESNGKYTIESKETLNTLGQLYNSSMELITSNDDDGDASNFKISNYSFTAGQTYYLKVSGTTTGDYKLKITPPETVGIDMEGNSLSTSKQFTGGLYSGAINKVI